MQVLRDTDIDPAPLANTCVAVIGYGSQGRAQALNLRDSGVQVVVALRPDSPSRARAAADGLVAADIPAAVQQSRVVMFLIPDEQQGETFERFVKPHLGEGACIGFAHGFAVHYGQITPSRGTAAFLVAPKGIGPMVRETYLAGRGVPALVGVQTAAGTVAGRSAGHAWPAIADAVPPAARAEHDTTLALALAYARAIGCGRAGVLLTTFRDETETDLFGEQAVLCGGLTELIRAGFETLVAGGYPPEMAYFECLHEVKLIADLIHTRGIAGMRAAISRTAAYGDVTRGRRIIGPAVRAEMREMLDEIRSGVFAREWLRENRTGQPHLRDRLAADTAHPIERIGAEIRALLEMSDGPPTGS